MIYYLEISYYLLQGFIYNYVYLYFSNFSAEDGLQSEIGSLHCELEQKQSCITESGERLNKIMV